MPSPTRRCVRSRSAGVVWTGTTTTFFFHSGTCWLSSGGGRAALLVKFKLELLSSDTWTKQLPRLVCKNQNLVLNSWKNWISLNKKTKRFVTGITFFGLVLGSYSWKTSFVCFYDQLTTSNKKNYIYISKDSSHKLRKIEQNARLYSYMY